MHEHGDEFDILHDHTGPVGVSVGALSNCPTIHTLHGPFTQQAHMLYSRVARQHWFVAISESQKDKDDYLFFLGGPTRRRRRTWPSRRPGGPGVGW